MISIAREISYSIKEGKWLSIRYASNKENRDTFFWCFVKDIDPNRKRLLVSMFNEKIALDTIEHWIDFSRIKEAEVINFSTCDFSSALIDKINKDIKSYDWLEFETFNNNILSYLDCCNKLDNDTSIHKFGMIEGIDAKTLKEKGTCNLNDSQVHQFCRIIRETDLSNYDKRSYEMALSRLSIDEGDKKYILAYQNILFSPSDLSLKLVSSIKINPTFLIEGKKISLQNFTELNPKEFLALLDSSFIEAEELIREGCSSRQIVNSRPDICCLERDFQVNLSSLFEMIETKWNEGKLNAPMDAFFGNASLKFNGRSKPNLAFFDDKVNADQALLTFNALKNKITYVQGPPGTGKTQTIFNTIVSSFFDNKTVLVSTNNNKPLDGIGKKMTFSYLGKSVPFPYLRLGNNDVVAKETRKIREFFKYINEESISSGELDLLRKEVFSKNKLGVDLLTKYQTRKALLDNLEFLDNIKDDAREKVWLKEKERVEKQLSELPIINEDELISSFVSIKDDDSANKYLYYSSINKLKKLATPKYKELLEIINIEEDSSRVAKFNGFTRDDNNLKLLTDVFPIIFSTNISSIKLGSSLFCFDLLIMDEAGQADVARSLIPLSRANALLLVGDEDQLLPVIGLDPSVNENLRKRFNISSTYDYLTNSILSTMQKADNVSNRVFLSTHYRCGKDIISFSNKRFYGNRLKYSPNLGKGKLSYYSCSNQVKSPVKNQNFVEAKAIVSYCKEHELKDASIITPFVNQAKLINEELEKEGITSIKASTIHSVQGDEKKTIIISTGISKYSSRNSMKWLNFHSEIANVAVSRAKDNLVVFSDENAINRISTGDSVWKDLIEYCKSNGNLEVVNANYSNLAIGKSNLSSSEDEFYKTIRQIVSIKKRLKVVRNVPLKDIVTDEEFQSSKMEFDSVIYEKNFLGAYKPIYAFEFNGGEHYLLSSRIETDKKKMELCKKHNVQLVTIPNFYSKDYEYLKKLIEDYSKDTNSSEQLSLF